MIRSEGKFLFCENLKKAGGFSGLFFVVEKYGMAARKVRAKNGRFNAAKRASFLAHLAESANVTKSARIAGVATSAVYAERRKSEQFRRDWMAALSEGYALLEAQLLEEALKVATGNVKDSTLKARAQKHRLALSLLAAHRASVKGSAAERHDMPKPDDDAAMRAELLAKLNLMRARIDQNKAILVPPGG